MRWEEITQKCEVIGEVSRVHESKIYVYVYQDKLHLVRIGSIVAVDSEGDKPMGVVLSVSVEPRAQTITPTRGMSREEIATAYPDIETAYHIRTAVVVYTSYLDTSGRIVHGRSRMPSLHDRVYILSDCDLLREFFAPDGQWNFEFLMYYIEGGASLTSLLDFITTHAEFFRRHDSEKSEIVEVLVDALIPLVDSKFLPAILRRVGQIW